jgi:TrmH family RNA methyltransferase
VLLSDGCADPFGPKTLRAAMGSTFRVPLLDFDVMPNAVALVAEGGERLDALDLQRYPNFVLGSEREGLPDEIVERCEVRGSIAIEAGLDSLNVAMAGTIALYEQSRRSRHRR